MIEKIIAGMSQGNNGAVKFLLQLIEEDKYEIVRALDAYGIKGPYLWSLYKDLCDEQIPLVVELVMKCPRETLIDACHSQDRSGKKQLIQQYLETFILTDVTSLTRDQVVPYYRNLILGDASDDEVKRVNQLVLSKWKNSGLTYIKEKAWKGIEYKFYNSENLNTATDETQ